MNNKAKIGIYSVVGFIILVGVLSVYFVRASPSTPDDSPIGYRIYNNTVEIWNTQNPYYFLKDKGIQLTNDPTSYWTKNIFCLGYYDNGKWNKIKCADELTNFEKSIESDDLTYVNATLWKDISYGAYDLRLGIQYHLGLNDENLSVTIYGKNIGIDIPFDLGFAWKVTDWDIPHEGIEGDSIFINQTDYNLDGTFDLLFKNMSHIQTNWTKNETTGRLIDNGLVTEYDSYFKGYDWTKFLRIDWNKNLDYAVKMVGGGNQEDFYVALLINAGHFNPNQEKATTIKWIDAEGDYTNTHWDTHADGMDHVESGMCVIEDWLYVCDWNDNLIYVYWQNGTFNNSIDISGSNTNCKGIGYDGTHLWTFKESGASGGYIYKLNMDGSSAGVSFAASEVGWNGNVVPVSGRLFVGDDTNKGFHQYETDGTYINFTSTGATQGYGGGFTIYGEFITGGYGWVSATGQHKRYLNGSHVMSWDRDSANAHARATAMNANYIYNWDYTDQEMYVYEGPEELPDVIIPNVTINTPTNTTYNTNTIIFNVTAVDETAMDSCWYNLDPAWDLSTAVYDSVSISTQDSSPTGLFFKSDGTKLYEMGFHNDKIYQYVCSDAWDLSTCSYDVDISLPTGYPAGLFFKSDGTKLYGVDFALDKIYQYVCSDAWNLSSCNVNDVNISTQNDESTDVFFKSDGTKLYEIGSASGDIIYQYTCSNAWDLSSCSYNDVNISAQDSNPQGLFFKSDGTKLYEIGVGASKIYQYTCSDAWNLSSCNYDINISNQDSSPTGLFFKSDGTKLYEVGTGDNKIYQYSMSKGILMSNSGDEWTSTNTSMTQGSHKAYFFCNDTSNNINNTESVSFYIDLICSPTLNEDWDISNAQVCNGVATTTGTGSINILSGGTLHLLNGANITTTKLELRTTGDQVFISPKSELVIG